MTEQKIIFSLVASFGVFLILGLVAIPTFDKARAAHSTNIIRDPSPTITKLQNQVKHDIRDPSCTITKGEKQVIAQEKSVVRTAHGEVAKIMPGSLNILFPTGSLLP